ncbi:MAG: CaiB/BaiF CoA-transferase family protein [Gammaproteobacteria bacterium]|nr:MAG: CaiB/BaiF CoA-transferase family protein [Gammaproteobacteria bacterium]
MRKPLEELKVLDLTRVLAGPYCTTLLADMGADVVKIERPGSGDDTRGYGPPFINGESAYFMSINRNKRSVTLNLKHEQGLSILGRMLETADIMVENFRPGQMEAFGYGYESVKAMNPRLVYCSISGYGHTGPKAQLPGYDLIVQGEGGIASLTGETDGPPYKVGTSQADIIAGMTAFQGILLALLARTHSDRGQKVDIGLLDCQVALLAYQAGIYFATGESPTRIGNRHPTISPYETFQCRDGYVNLGCGNDSMWRRFCAAVGLEALVEDERFRTNPDRVKHSRQLRALLQPLMMQKTTQQWIDTLRPRGVPCGPIQTVKEVFEDPQVLARDMVVTLEHEKAGTIRVTGNPIKLSETPGAVDTPPPALGAHTAEVLSDWLDLGEAEVNKLRQDGVL